MKNLQKLTLKLLAPPIPQKQWAWMVMISLIKHCVAQLTLASKKHYLCLKAIEASCGRERDPNNKFTPRTLDLDIIHWNDFDGIMEGYKLPDPDIKNTTTLSVPLAEIFKD